MKFSVVVCAHCGRGSGRNHGRGLCRKCHERPAVRERYLVVRPQNGGRCRHCARPASKKSLRWGLCPTCAGKTVIFNQYSHRPWKNSPCLHCKTRSGTQARGLCRNCYNTPGLREQYPTQNATRPSGKGDDFYGAGSVPEPTKHFPGTDEYAEVLAGRVAARQQLFHPLDARRAV